MYWSFTEGLRDIRYNIEYAKISYRQRYYSTSHNPRVIQARMGNDQLLSLRTYPHDKYLIKPGQFLALERRACHRPAGVGGAVLLSEEVPIDPFLDFSRLNSVEDGGDSREMGQSFEDASPPEGSQAETTECSKSPHYSIKDRLRGFRERYQSMHSSSQLSPSQVSLPSPILETACKSATYSAAEANYARQEAANPAAHLAQQQQPLLAPRPSAPVTVPPPSRVPSGSVFSLRRLLAGADATDSPRARQHPPGSVDSKQSNGSEPWKNVYNDISLTAARVSIGQPPKSRSHFKNLSSDFIAAQMCHQENESRASAWAAPPPRGMRRAVSESDVLRSINPQSAGELRRPLSKGESSDYYYDHDILSLYELTINN